MGAEGKKLAAERFTTDAMMSQITGVYASLLNESKSCRPSSSNALRSL